LSKGITQLFFKPLLNLYCTSGKNKDAALLAKKDFFCNFVIFFEAHNRLVLYLIKVRRLLDVGTVFFSQL